MPGSILYIYTTTGTIEEVAPDHWVAVCKEWGITAHGKSRLEADLRLEMATGLLANKIADRGTLGDEFNRVGIKFRTIEFPDSEAELRTVPFKPPPPAYTINDPEILKRFSFNRSDMVVR